MQDLCPGGRSEAGQTAMILFLTKSPRRLSSELLVTLGPVTYYMFVPALSQCHAVALNGPIPTASALNEV